MHVLQIKHNRAPNFLCYPNATNQHHYGWEVEESVEAARGHVGKMIGADAKEIIFTSGATECNNMAIKGGVYRSYFILFEWVWARPSVRASHVANNTVARFYAAKKKHIITTTTEHKCVLDSCRVLQNEGFDITYLPVQVCRICAYVVCLSWQSCWLTL